MSTTDLKKEMPNNQGKSKFRSYIRLTGVSLIVAGMLILLFTYLPILLNIVNYHLDKDQLNNDANEVELEIENIEPGNLIDKGTELSKYFPDNKFSLYIPTIGAKSNVIRNVDPFNEREYMSALEKGIAHAKNGYLPGDAGNTFLFAHSALDFYALRSLNVNFYLLDQLKEGDKIYLMYDDEVFTYVVSDNILVDPAEVDYLKKRGEKESVTLMTCWPAGTDYKRVIIYAEISE